MTSPSRTPGGAADREISHPDPAFDDLRDKTSERLRIEHEVVAAKVDEGRVDGGAIKGVGAPGR
jgi:hypothetical protein